jgi:hypothetical protein
MLQIYGTLKSRATRCLWMLEEVGQPYELAGSAGTGYPVEHLGGIGA